MTLRFGLLTGVAVLLAGCASATSGTGSVNTPATTPALSSPAPSSSSTSVSATAAPSESESTSTSSSGCDPAADYCDNFSVASSGWPVDNEPNYFANYSKYLGGTYRMGERTSNAKTQLAPVDTTTISKDYSVQIDVDAIVGASAPPGSFIGIACWDHETSKGSEAAFFFFVTADSVDVTLLPDNGGDLQTLDRNQGGVFVKPYPSVNHLTATCIQQRTSSGTTADLSLVVNGASVLHEQYAKSVKNYPWTPGSGVGLLVAGKKSNVFYDNFAVTGQ